MIYLDNGATTFPKPERVIEEMSRFMRETMANPGRSGHKMATETNRRILETRIKLARLIGAENPLQLAFTKNASEALNIGILGYLEKGDHVITTSMEHNSVARPLYKLQHDEIIDLSLVKGDHDGFIGVDEILSEIKPETSMVVMTHASNLLGSINDIKTIGQELAKINEKRENKIAFMVDCAQTLGSIPVNVTDMHISILAGAGHKSLYGPTGTGFIYVDENTDIRPLYFGGTGSLSESLVQPEFMPDMLETGTLNAVGIVGLGEGIDYIEQKGIENIRNHQRQIVFYCLAALEQLENVKIYGTKDETRRAGVVSFNIGDMDSQEVTGILSEKYNIATRGGMHCTPLAHGRMGTSGQGMVRASFSSFTKESDIDSLAEAVKQIAAAYEQE